MATAAASSSSPSSSYYIDRTLGLISNVNDTSKRSMELMGELDAMVQKLSAKIDDLLESPNPLDVKEEIILLRKIVESLSERKSQLAVKNYDLIDQNMKVLDQGLVVIQKALTLNENFLPVPLAVDAQNDKPHVGRKRKFAIESEPIAESYATIDPNEPLYCTCRRFAFGDMIACDNENCEIEWFHYQCVNLTKKPRNNWLCPTCASTAK